MNIATNTMQKMTNMLRAIDGKYKVYATEPYGQKKLSAKEQMDLYKSMTPEKLLNALDTLDSDSFRKFNEWLFKMEKKEQND